MITPLRLALSLAIFLPHGAFAQEAALAGSEWRATTIAGVPVPEEVEAFLQFRDDSRLTGSGGCNRFTGTYETAGETLAIGPLASTRMACPGPAMEIEHRLFATLEEVRGFRRDRAEMVLAGEDGTPLVVLVQTDWD